MILVKKRKCIKCKEKQATYNIEGERAEYCNSCKTDIMINVNDKCKNDMCVRTGSIKYKYYCTFCFQHLFPNDPLTLQIRLKTKEIAVRAFINQNFEGFQHDVPLWIGNCECVHRRRIDHRKLIGNTILAIETDEFAHNSYDEKDEEIRYDDLYMIHSGKWIFIRFNPDGKNVDLEDKLHELVRVIQQQIKVIEREENKELLEIIKMYY